MAAPPRPGHQAAGRAEAQPGGHVRVQRQRDERVADGRQRDPGTRAADRRHRLRQHRIAEVTRAEQLLDRHAERPGQAEGDPQRRIGMAGLDGGHRLPGDAGHAGQLLLGQAASLPGQPQPRPVRLGDLRHVPTSPSRGLILTLRPGGPGPGRSPAGCGRGRRTRRRRRAPSAGAHDRPL